MNAHETGHKRQMDGLRFLAFLAIFFYHADLVRFWFASYSVHLFFVLSGFLITGILLDQGDAPAAKVLYAFYARRCLRIFPAYYLMITLLLFFGMLPYPAWSYTYTFNLKLFLLSLTDQAGPLLQHWKSWGIHLWSLCVEEQYYLFYPLLFLAVPGRFRFLLLAGLALGVFFTRFAFAAFLPESYFGVLLPVVGQYLIFGGLAACAQRKIALPQGFPAGMICAGAGLAALVLAAGGRPEILVPQFSPGSRQILMAAAFSLIVWGLWADDQSVFARFLAFRPFAYLGKISYGLYLVHLAAWSVSERLVEKFSWAGQVPEALLVFLLTVGAAALSWHFFERPLNQLKRHFPYPQRELHAG